VEVWFVRFQWCSRVASGGDLEGETFCVSLVESQNLLCANICEVVFKLPSK